MKVVVAFALCMIVASVAALEDVPKPPMIPNQWTSGYVMSTSGKDYLGYLYYDYTAQKSRVDVMSNNLYLQQFTSYSNGKPTAYPEDVIYTSAFQNNAYCTKDGSPASDLPAQNILQGFTFDGQTEFMGTFCNMFSDSDASSMQTTTFFVDVSTNGLAGLQTFNQTTGTTDSTIVFVDFVDTPIESGIFTLPSACSSSDKDAALASDAKLYSSVASTVANLISA